MVSSILATKLYIPPASPNYVLRHRLADRLNQGLGRKLTLVSAPAGFGKTTLVSEWAKCCANDEVATQNDLAVRTAWLSLDEGDSDPVRFMSYFIAALRTVVPGLGEGIEETLQSAQPPIESILVALLNDVATVTGKIILVLDDYHVIDSRQVDEAITYLIDHLPPAMHLVITTREDPQLPLARLRARGQLTELRVSDLRFTPAEVSGFFDQMLGMRLSTEEITDFRIPYRRLDCRAATRRPCDARNAWARRHGQLYPILFGNPRFRDGLSDRGSFATADRKRAKFPAAYIHP